MIHCRVAVIVSASVLPLFFLFVFYSLLWATWNTSVARGKSVGYKYFHNLINKWKKVKHHVCREDAHPSFHASGTWGGSIRNNNTMLCELVHFSTMWTPHNCRINTKLQGYRVQMSWLRTSEDQWKCAPMLCLLDSAGSVEMILTICCPPYYIKTCSILNP